MVVVEVEEDVIFQIVQKKDKKSVCGRGMMGKR